MKKLVFFTVLCSWALLLNAQVNGKITSIKDSDGKDLDYANVKKGEVYTINFEGNNIKDIHIKLGDETATASFHAGSMPEDSSDSNVDIHLGSFTNGTTFQSSGTAESEGSEGKYMSLYKGGEPLSSGQFQMRFNSGTPGMGSKIIFTSDGNGDPFNGEVGTDWWWGDTVHGWRPPTLISTVEPIPTLSEWGVIILILLMLATGMVYLYKRQLSPAYAGELEGSTQQSKAFLFNKRLFAKVFGVTLIAGLAFLGLTYLIAGKITSADPLGVLLSAAIMAYMIHYMILRHHQV